MSLLNQQDELICALLRRQGHMYSALEKLPAGRAQVKSFLELKAVTLSYLKCSLIWTRNILLLPRGGIV